MKSTLLSLSLCLVLCLSMNEFDASVGLTYGGVLRVISPYSGKILHSHDIFFGRGGVMSVTGYHIDDLGSFWQINEEHGKKTKTYKDPVHCGDVITLSSVIIGYFLRVEETQFGLTTELLPMVHGMNAQNVDEKINFQIQCVQKEHGSIHYNDQIRLKHAITGKYVSLDSAYAYTEANCGRGCEIAGQLELHAIDNHNDESTVFQVKTGMSLEGEQEVAIE